MLKASNADCSVLPRQLLQSSGIIISILCQTRISRCSTSAGVLFVIWSLWVMGEGFADLCGGRSL